MNSKMLQYLMGHSDIGVTLNTYTHLGLEDAAGEIEADGRTGGCQKRTGEGQRREYCFAEVAG